MLFENEIVMTALFVWFFSRRDQQRDKQFCIYSSLLAFCIRIRHTFLYKFPQMKRDSRPLI